MKICVIGPVYPYRGGIAHFTTLLVKNMIQEGHDVQTISFKKQYPKWLYPGKSDKDYSKSREKVEADFIITPFNPFSWKKAIERITNFQPDKVIFPWWVTVWGPCFKIIAHAIKRKEIPVTFLVHNTLPHEARSIDRIITQCTLKEADQFIVMTKKEEQKILNLLPKTKDIHVVSHPIYNMFKPTGMERKAILQKLELPENKKFVLFFGFVRPYKGLSDLLQAIEICNREEPQIHLIVAGEFWGDRDQYFKQIRSLELQDTVHIFDQYILDSDVAMYFEVSDLFVAPYTGGTQSGAVKTALGFGMPAVITDVIVDDIVRELPNLISIVPSGNPQELAGAIRNKINKAIPMQQSNQDNIAQSWRNFIHKLVNHNSSTETT